MIRTEFPPASQRKPIRIVAEMINRLWGHHTPGGRLYGEPPASLVVALQWIEGDGWTERRLYDGLDWLGAPREPVSEHERWFLVELAESEPWMTHWRPDVQATMYPSRCLWQGETSDGVQDAWKKYLEVNGKPALQEWRDRLFLVRRDDYSFESCRSTDQFLALASDLRDVPGKRWAIYRADFPGDVVTYLQLSLHEPDRQHYASLEAVGEYELWSRAAERLENIGIEK